ncbi:MAG: hypothetical protein JSS69_02525 [Acidobacteria bacterium]|nr:hypothetical protein [Acidobacteriota bacterium]MBS1864769.1 hypothetical protein [Acidobacteriota bacterium]
MSEIRSWFDRNDDFISIVLLLRQPRKIGETVLREAAERAWNVKLETGEKAQNFVVVNAMVRFVKIHGHFFQVLTAARPYITDVEFAVALASDELVKTAIIAHKAWLSVDYITSRNSQLSEDARYAATGKLIAELVDETCLAICVPDKDLIVPATPTATKILRNMKTAGDLADALH